MSSSTNNIFPLLLLLLSIVGIVFSVVEVAFTNSIDDSRPALLALSYAILMELTPDADADEDIEPSSKHRCI